MLAETLAISSLVSQGAGMLGGLSAGGQAKKAARAQKRTIRREGAARLRDLYREEQAILGEQRTRYAAGGVASGIGSALLAQKETKDSYARQQALSAYMTQQKERGAQTALNAQQTSLAAGFASDFSQLAQTAWSFNQARPTKP